MTAVEKLIKWVEGADIEKWVKGTAAVAGSLLGIWATVKLIKGATAIGGLLGFVLAWAVLSMWVIIKMREIKKGSKWVIY